MTLSPTELTAPSMRDGFVPPYYPPSVRAARPRGARTYAGITYAAPVGYRNLQLDLHVPDDASAESPAPVVVWIHGGAWMFGGRELLPPNWPLGSVDQLLIDAGIAVATIDYRHAREAAFPAQLHDAKAAIRYLRAFADELGLDAGRVGVWGESAGGHLAALCALVGGDPRLEGSIGVADGDSSVAAAVCFYPVTDVDTMPAEDHLPEAVTAAMLAQFGEVLPPPTDELLDGSPYTRDEGRRIVSPVQHARADAPPFLFVHGELDRGVPPSQSRELADALTAAGSSAEVVIVPGAEHVFDGVDPMPQLERAVRFLADTLRREAVAS
ncbi:alpha/beta hydrolase [Microbacterium sp. B19]|uniref:alpha/beta hydrolase n=1 Tax=Microbacterium sp. B19 TaxID=96765 RepID=UPI000344B3F1|nr:alpha/beta hydrolase [Microbacterium sp. B19]